MDDDDDDYGEETPDLGRSAPVRKIDWLIVGLDYARQVAAATSSFIWSAEQLLIGQANHQVDQAVFMDEARRQIEMMTEGD